MAPSASSAPAPAGERWPAALTQVGEIAATAHGHGAYTARVLTSDVAAFAARRVVDGLVACAAHEARGGGAGPFVCWRVERPLPHYSVSASPSGPVVREGRLDDCAGCHDPGPLLAP